MECFYLPWPSPVHSLSLLNCRKASTGATPLLQNFIKNLQTPRQGPGSLLHGGDLCSVHSPSIWLYFSKSEDADFTASIYTIGPRHTSHAILLPLSVRTIKTLTGDGPTSMFLNRKSQAAPRSPLLLLKLFTQVDQLCLSIWLIHYKLSHTGGPLRMPLLGCKLLMLHFLLNNRPWCQVGTCSLIMFIITITYHLAARGVWFFRAMEFLL